MDFRAGAHQGFAGLRGFSRLRAKLARFRLDRRGVAAVEFAFIAPILLAMYFMTMEVSQGIETNKKVSRIGSMVADLVTQQSAVTKSDLDAIMKIGDSTLLPYHRSNPKIVITGITISGDSTPKVTVDWSRKLVNGVSSADATNGAKTTIPATLIQPNSYLVRVESDLNYKPVIAWAADGKAALGLVSAFSSISMGETYYLRPRMTSTVTCSDCYK